MTTSSTWTTVAHDPQPRSDWAARPRYAPTDFVTLLWRERWLMIAVFLVIFVIGAGFSLTLKKTYAASASLFVRLGQEYVYEPRAGDAGRGAVPEVDQVIQSEAEILGSGELKERTIRKVGLVVMFPDLAKAYARATPAEKRLIMAKARDGMGRHLKIETAPDNSIIRLSYDHEDPDVAVKVLNSLLEEYLVYRRNLLIPSDQGALTQQKTLFEQRLADTDAAYQNFLSSNDIGDFTSQKTSLTTLQGQIEAQRYAAETQLKDRRARLASTDRLLAQTAPEVGLFRDISTAAPDKLAQLKLEREGMLSRYKPDAQPVKDMDAQIAQLEASITAGRMTSDGARRFGANPVYQTLLTDRNNLASEVAALVQQVQAFTDQGEQVTQRLLRLAALEPRFIELTRDRDVLQTNVRDFVVKAQQDEAARQLASADNNNIRIVQRASAPSTGSSLKKPVFVLAFLFAGFTALCAGLLRMFLRPGLQTPASASRTLDLPVLATASYKR
ncbi:MAG: GumC family protein [Caulobacterales bacterium]|nr:GumC family protein [Caulobacterales bacterium]